MKLKGILSETFTNLFADDIDSALLLNIASGSSVSPEVEKCLLELAKREEELCIEFTSRFEKNNKNKLHF